MDEIATSLVLLINMFSQKMETSFKPKGWVNLLHKLVLITTPNTEGGGGSPKERMSSHQLKGTRHFFSLKESQTKPRCRIYTLQTSFHLLSVRQNWLAPAHSCFLSDEATKDQPRPALVMGPKWAIQSMECFPPLRISHLQFKNNPLVAQPCSWWLALRKESSCHWVSPEDWQSTATRELLLPLLQHWQDTSRKLLLLQLLLALKWNGR